MQPPEGRLQIGDNVELPSGRRGRVIGEREIATNGAWFYSVELDGAETVESPDYELKRV